MKLARLEGEEQRRMCPLLRVVPEAEYLTYISCTHDDVGRILFTCLIRSHIFCKHAKCHGME